MRWGTAICEPMLAKAALGIHLTDASSEPRALQRTIRRRDLLFLYNNIIRLAKGIEGLFRSIPTRPLQPQKKRGRNSTLDTFPQALVTRVGSCHIVESAFPQMVVYCPPPAAKAVAFLRVRQAFPQQLPGPAQPAVAGEFPQHAVSPAPGRLLFLTPEREETGESIFLTWALPQA
jgi:hypothetical protein